MKDKNPVRKIKGFESPEEFLRAYERMRKVILLANDINKSTGAVNILVELTRMAEEAFDDLVKLDLAVEQFLKELGFENDR